MDVIRLSYKAEFTTQMYWPASHTPLFPAQGSRHCGNQLFLLAGVGHFVIDLIQDLTDSQTTHGSNGSQKHFWFGIFDSAHVTNVIMYARFMSTSSSRNNPFIIEYGLKKLAQLLFGAH